VTVTTPMDHPVLPKVNAARVREDLLVLLAIPSPALREKLVMDALCQRLSAAGFAYELDGAGTQLGGEVGNLIVRIPGNGGRDEALLLNAHVDTVVPCEGVRPVERDGVVYSAGDTVLGADDKTGVVALLEAIRTVEEQSVPHGPIELVFTVAEETGLNGAKRLDMSRLRARRGYVFDGSAKIGCGTLAAPSHDNLEVLIRGKAAHAGMRPEQGISAITLASKAIAQMKLGRLDAETTANVGVIEGGQATNIVPEEVRVRCEARSHDPAKLAAQIRHMQELFESCATAGGGVAECSVDRKYRAFAVPEDDPLVRLASRAAERLGLRPRWKAGGGGSDANVFNERGLKTVILNSGQQNPHTTQECTALKDVVLAAQHAVAIIALFGEETYSGGT